MVTDSPSLQTKLENAKSLDEVHPFAESNHPFSQPTRVAESTSRSLLHAPAVPSIQDIANDWKSASNATTEQSRNALFGKSNQEIALRAGSVAKGGSTAISDLETRLNAELKDVAGGPYLEYDQAGNKLTILNLRPASAKENLDISTKLATGKLTEQQLKEQGYRDAQNTSDRTVSLYVPIVKPETIDLSKNGKVEKLQLGATDNTGAGNNSPAWGDKIAGAGTLPPSPYVFAALTDALKNDLKMDPSWKANNSPQKELLKASASLGPEVDALRKLGLLDGSAQKGGVDKVNEMFARHGIPIKLDPIGKSDIAAGGVFDFKAKWEGKATTLTANGADGQPQQFDAFEKAVKSYNVDGQTVLEVYRDNEKGITMYMAPTDGELKGYAAYARAFELTPGQNTPSADYSKAIIPKMKVRDEGDVPQLLGMEAAGGFSVSQAKIFTSADFDQSGAEIKQGLGVALTRGLLIQHPTFTMDKPPLVWVVQDGASKPLIAFRVAQDSWKDPKKN